MTITTTGMIQRLSILPTGFACVYIGPTLTNVEAFLRRKSPSDTATELAWKNSLVCALASCMTALQPVWVTHSDTDSEITAVSLGAGFAF